MPARQTPLVNGEIYHVVNRGNNSTPIFKGAKDYKRFIHAMKFYQLQNRSLPFSGFLKLSQRKRKQILKRADSPNNYLVEIIAYCLMPNHFHLLLKQVAHDGTLNFLRLTTNSYSKYFNIKYKRKGSLFEGRFKAIRVENEEQLLHLSRYIHLNPYSGFILKEIKNLPSYPYSSLSEYLKTNSDDFCQKRLILSYFKNPKEYKEFIINQADYQRKLEIIKHQTIE